jgi:hypothetical protein
VEPSRVCAYSWLGPCHEVLIAMSPYGSLTYRGVHGTEKLVRDNVLRVTCRSDKLVIVFFAARSVVHGVNFVWLFGCLGTFA